MKDLDDITTQEEFTDLLDHWIFDGIIRNNFV